MVNILKFSRAENAPKWYVIADLHYCHEKLVESRGFKNIEEHNAAIIKGVNSKVTERDTLFLLGDTVLGAGDKSLETFNYILQVLNYRELYVMPGNHWAGFRTLFNGQMQNKIDEYYRLKIETGSGRTIYFIPNYYEIFVGSQPIILSHYPIVSWNGISKGVIHLFGHEHSNLSGVPWLEENYLIRKCMDVGFEAIGSPLEFSEIMSIMDKKQIVGVGHH